MARTVECIQVQLRLETSRDIEQLSWMWKPLSRLLGRVYRWQVISRQRKELAQLSDRMLKDIGLSRIDAQREAGRPFWDDRGLPRQSVVSGE